MSHAPSTAAHAMPPKRPRPRRRWLRVLLWLVIFGSGFVAGTGLTLMAVRQGLLQAIHHPEQMPTNVSQRLRRSLHLDDQQTQQVREILRRRQDDLEQIRMHYQPEVEQQLDLIRAEIGQVLDDQQRETWYRIFDNKRRIWVPPLPGEENAGDADRSSTQPGGGHTTPHSSKTGTGSELTCGMKVTYIAETRCLSPFSNAHLTVGVFFHCRVYPCVSIRVRS